MTETQPIDSSSNDSSSRFVRYLIVGVVGLAMFPIGLAILFGMGQHHGTEFSPDDFSRRTFSYNQSPWFNWILAKKTYYDTTGGFDRDLIADGLIQQELHAPQVWHLVSDLGSTQNGLVSHDCDARFLTNYLDLTDDEGDYYWGVWNEEFPIAANLFWPQIADLARHEMYLKIPDVMKFAMNLETDGSDPFQENLEQLVAQCYLEMGVIDLQLNRYERAKIRLSRSNAIQASDDAKRRLAECVLNMSLEDDQGDVIPDNSATRLPVEKDRQTTDGAGE